MRAAIYARVSTRGQADDDRYSLPTQIDGCRQYIKERGWTVEESHIYHDVRTGAQLWEREALTELRDAIARRDVDVVVVYAFDRLARLQRDQNYLAVEAKRYGVRFDSVTEDFDESPIGIFMRSAAGFVAEQERLKFIERSRRGRMARVQSGKYPVGPRAPFGYRYANEEKTHLIIHEEEAEIVRWIYEQAANGWGVVRIGERLRAEGVKHSSGKSNWWATSIRDIIRKELYKGRVYGMMYESYINEQGKTTRRLRPREEWIEVPNVAPAIVDDVLWDKANLGLSNRSRRRSVSKVEKELLIPNGQVRCGKCNTALNRVAGIKGRGYRNSKDKYVHKGDAAKFHNCTVTAINGDIVDEWVWGELVKLFDDECRVQGMLQERMEDNPFTRNVSTVEEALKLAKKQHAKEMETLRTIGLELDEYSRAQLTAGLKQKAQEITSMEQELRVLRAQEKEENDKKELLNSLSKIVKHLPRKMQKMTMEEKRDFVVLFDVLVKLYPKSHDTRLELYINPSMENVERLLIATQPSKTPQNRANLVSIHSESSSSNSLRWDTHSWYLVAAA